ncbi:MAG: MFS transporter, partial [Actinobacteria bacterium]|nr:MFS transporter [Actinomycetota bacterium]
VSEKLPLKRLGEGIGWFGISFIVAAAIGPGIGAVIGSEFGYHVSFMVSGLLFLAAVILTLRITSGDATQGDPHANVSRAAAFKMRVSELRVNLRAAFGEMSSLHIDDLICVPALPLTFFAGIFGLVVGTINTFIVVFAEHRGISGVSLYFVVAAVSLFAARLVSGRIIDRRGLSIVLYPAFILVITAALLFAGAYSLWVILLCAVLISLGQGLAQPALQTICMRIGREDNGKIGVAASTYFIGPDIGQGIGPMISGAISDGFGFSGMFMFCAVTVALSTVVYAFYTGRRKTKVSPTDR